jgi:hypothetical protein
VAISLLTACGAPAHRGDTVGRKGTGASSVPAAAVGRAGWPASGFAAEVLYYYVPATGPQYAVGAQFSGIYSALQNDIVSACMARSGFDLPRTPAAVYTAQDFDNSQWPDLAAISRSEMLDPGLRYGQPNITIPRAEQQAYQADSARCENAQQAIFVPMIRAGGSLLTAWLATVSRVQASAQLLAALAGFTSCVERAGTPASSAGSFDYFLAWVTGLEAVAPTQAAALAADQHWARVFVPCAARAVAIQDRLELTQQAVFLEDHQQQIQALESIASQLITRLERRYGVPGPG